MGRLDTPVGERTFWGFCIREMKPPGRAAPCSQVGAYPRERTEAPKDRKCGLLSLAGFLSKPFREMASTYAECINRTLVLKVLLCRNSHNVLIAVFKYEFVS